MRRMVGYAYVIEEYAPVPGDDVKPSRWRRWIAGGVLAAAASVVSVMIVPASGAPTLSATDISGGHEVGLTTTWTVSDPAVGSKYTIRLPNRPATKPTGAQTLEGYADFARIKLNGKPSAYLLLGRFGKEVKPSAKDALVEMTAQKAAVSGYKTHSAIRSTSVGDTPAYAEDFVLPNAQNLREFRFVHKGSVYSAGILWHSSDTVSLDTALAALATLQWID